MKKYFYLLICFGIFLASCGSHKPPEIPFKQIPKDTASLMWKKYNVPPIQADTSYREVPKMYGFDITTLETITAQSDSGKVVEVNFFIAAYLDVRPEYEKNTVIMQIVRERDSKKYYYFYDLRQRLGPLLTSTTGGEQGLPLCPPPPDCIPPGMGDAQN
ncbi:MAG TPA: hypothetical protein VK483_16295 [Chitinophagaceae bacterium]|nr:hypothetical protein [Chitinophagaceae bacterium]